MLVGVLVGFVVIVYDFFLIWLLLCEVAFFFYMKKDYYNIYRYFNDCVCYI